MNTARLLALALIFVGGLGFGIAAGISAERSHHRPPLVAAMYPTPAAAISARSL